MEQNDEKKGQNVTRNIAIRLVLSTMENVTRNITKIDFSVHP